jgi:DNA-binding NarL/FixJ family response regulator
VHLARKRGEEVPPALLAIEEAGADAARELRETLGALRAQDDCDGSGLGHLDGLVARARAAGLPVTVTVTGPRRPLPLDVDQAAYRIVQEALTNVSRHAGGARASVHLRYAADALTVQVDDDGEGAGARSAGPGLGLIGMRERVSALGGRLHAEPQARGGCRVRAELPVQSAPPGPASTVIRILLADDQALIRSGIRALLEAEDDIQVVAEASDGKQAVVLAREHHPDIALVDIQMPVLDGIEATRQIVADERLASVRVVILTNFGLDEYIFRALRAGASGFLLKDMQPAELLRALRVVMRGDALLSPAVTRRLISEFVARPPDAIAAAGMETLANREREVVALAAHGLSNDEIADAMVLSPTTAKTHVSRAMIKLGARDRAQLVVFAYQSGLVSPRDPVPRR